MRTFVLFAVVLAASCTKTSDKFCGLHPADERCFDATNDGGGCVVDQQCKAEGLGVCQVSDGTCVQCTADNTDACSGVTPVCDANACRKCTADSDCASELCLEDGSCAAEDDVAYVTATGSNAACSRETPCGDLQAAEDTLHKYIKITGAVTDAGPAVFQSNTRTIYGEGASLSVQGNAATIIQISGNPTALTIHGLELRGANGANGAVISMPDTEGAQLVLDRVRVFGNAGTGLSAAGGKVTISRSMFVQNLTMGIRIDGGEYQITNSIFVQNGKPAVNTGGVILAPSSPSSRFDFNTVADNIAAGGASRIGIQCSGAPALTNSIIVGNNYGSCTLSYALTDAMAPGTGNVAGATGFIDTTDTRSPSFYRIGPTSKALDKASPAALEMVDFDGQARPAGTARDIGADEYVP